jgi:hypothetical protein
MHGVKFCLRFVGLASALTLGATCASAEAALWLKLPFSGKCIDIAEGSIRNGAKAIQFDCRNQSNQRWFLRQTENQHEYEIVNQHNGKCLEISEGSTAEKASAQQWDCNHKNHQRYRLIENGSSGGYTVYIFRVVHSSQCLDVSGGSIGNGVQIVQFNCTGGTNQNISTQR